MTSTFIWFLIGFSLFLLEAFFPGLILFFFGFGAWITAIITWWFPVSLGWQLVIFSGSSSLLLFLLRRYLSTIFSGRTILNSTPEGEDFDEYVGQKAVVKVPINPNTTGKVEFHGTLWIAEANEILEMDTPVKIIARNNITLIVTALFSVT